MTSAFEDENEQTVTIDEYIKGVEAEELEADLVLGGDEGNECTYNTGYMKRQAIFSCLTCAPDGNAGVCTACSLSCHDGHEIVELWPKRNFRCDCGNSRFGEFFCKLCPNKDVENTKNSYNHNFKGKYCTCGRPYPDPDAEEQEEMIQCIVCEDWFHEEHLGLDSSDQIPRDDEGEPCYEDFICKGCSATCSFLTHYPRTVWAIAGKKVDASISIRKDKDVVVDNPSAYGSGNIENGTSHDSPVKDDIPANASDQSRSPGVKSIDGESSEKHIAEHECGKDVNVPMTCPLSGEEVANSLDIDTKPLFLSKGWRQMLCRCEKCLDMYNHRHISYLLDNEDSIAEYEKMAKQKREEKLHQQEGDEMKFFNKLGHVEKLEILNGIADFKDEFHSFLESCDTSKTITSTDVHQFFENLAKKRRRTE